jgi:hypothetical protein
MPDINEIISRIEQDLDQLESAQQLIAKTSSQAENLQNVANELVGRSNAHMEAMMKRLQDFSDTFEFNLLDLQRKHDLILRELEEFDLPRLQEILLGHQQNVEKKLQLASEALHEEVGVKLQGVHTALAALQQNYQQNSQLIQNFTSEVSQLANMILGNSAQFSALQETVNGFSTKLNAIEVIFSGQLKQFGTTITSQLESVENTLNAVNRHMNNKFSDISDQVTRRFEENKVFQERQFEDIGIQSQKIQASTLHLQANLSKNIKELRIWVLLLFLSLVVGFGGILFFLNRNGNPTRSAASSLLPPAENSENTAAVDDSPTAQEIQAPPMETTPANPEQNPVEQQVPAKDTAKLNPSENKANSEKNAQKERFEHMAGTVLSGLARKSYAALDRDMVHSGKGINFYPEGLENESRMFNASSFGNLMANTRIYDWGTLDAESGNFRGTIGTFFEQYILKDAFLKNARTAVNQITFSGGNNLSSTKIERRFKQPLAYTEYAANGRSLVFVFQKDYMIDSWYLIAIVYN